MKALLGKHVKILLKNVVKLETKPDKLENRVLVSVRLVQNYINSSNINIFYFFLGIFTMSTLSFNSKGAYQGKFLQNSFDIFKLN